MTPQKLSDLDIAFPTDVSQLMPDYSDIPDEFKSQSNEYVKLTNEWFFEGLSTSKLKAKSGIDEDTAFNHLAAIQGSWDPKHEHKTASVAYLMSLWFDI